MASDPRRATIPAPGSEPSDREMYDNLRDGGLTHEQAVAQVEARRSSSRPAPTAPAGVSGALRTTAQGATFGLADEFEGIAARGEGPALRDEYNFRTTFPEPRARAVADSTQHARTAEARQDVDQFRDDHPIGAIALEGAGALTTAPLGAAAAGLRAGAAAPSLARLAGVGAAEAAVYGAGAAEGSLYDRIKGGAAAAPVGAFFGAAAPAVTGAATGAGRRVLDTLGLRPAGGGQSGPIGRVAEAAGIRSMADRASDKLSDAVLADAGSFDLARQQLARGGDKPVSLMDLGDNTAGVARASRATPGTAKNEIPQFFGSRMADQEDRLIGDLLETTGVRARNDVVQTTEDLITQRAESARPLYEAAYQRSVPVSAVVDDLKLPEFRRAYDRGRAIARADGVELPALNIDALADLGVDAASVQGLPEIPIQAVDYMKRGLDDLIEARMRGGKMGKAQARALRNRLRGTLERVDELVPEYGAARAAFQGESAMMEAFEQGQELFRMDPSAARKALEAMSDGERELFRKGAVESIATRLEDVASTHDATVRRPLQDRTRDRQRLRLLFDSDEAFEAFKDRLQQEVEMSGTGRFVLGGSNTADKLMELAQLADVTVGPAFDVATGNGLGLMRRMAESGVRRRAQGYSGQLSEAMAPQLTATGQKAADVVDGLSRYQRIQLQNQNRRRALTAGTAGALTGLRFGRDDDQ